MLKTLMRQVKQYKTVSIVTPIFAALEVLMETLIPFVTAWLIDRGIQAGNMSEIWKYGLMMLALSFLSLLFGFLAAKPQPRPPPALPATCATPCIRTSSAFLFPTLTSFPPRVLSPG